MTARHVFFAVALCSLLVLSGCASIGSAISGAGTAAQQPAPSSGTQAQQSQQPSSGPAFAYQDQFNSFYAATWSFGWFGYKDGGYTPGQGTVWQINGKGSWEPTTFERAYLKLNSDETQWWRLKISGRKDEIVYEFLVGSDSVLQKVRCKDPESGDIVEFVPDQSQAQPSAAPQQPTREQIANSLVGSENITVKAGTFTTDHYSYTDSRNGSWGDIWTSKKVPGSMVRFIGVNPKNKATSSGELVQVETGVTTVLGSF